MTHVIAEPCVGTKDTACVEVCPVDCIKQAGDESSEMLYIDPTDCIDCAACVPACPVDAIFAEGDLPSKWAKYTQINLDFFASGDAVAASASGGGGASAKKKAPEPEPLLPLDLNPQEIYQSLSELRGDLAEQRQMSDADLRAKKTPAIVGLVVAAVLILLFAIGNNFSKAMDFSLYSKLGAHAIGKRKPKLGGSEYSLGKKVGGKQYKMTISDSIFGSRTLTLQVQLAPFSDTIYHEDEKYFAFNKNQDSRFYYVFIDEKSNGSLDSILRVRELWSKENQFLGRYQKPLTPTDELEKRYHREARKLAQQLGL